ncbi:DNA polymerase Y family protein [Paractinoplanes maris]|uniref:DNA polymerase Y family protein n=1 Tax=Paractinoplanes maris TaxID=1734446 RepID=UPI0020204968|nr:DNA polymerase Y family protein [Actinoplanes maris]
MSAGGRTMLLWCPDWPVVAAEIVLGIPAAQAVVVVHGNRVIACSEVARREGVRRGLRRREAQSRCPQVTAVEHDPGRDARAFEPVVAAVEEVAVGVEVIRPGALAFAARGPSRYFGGEEAAAERIVEQVAQACEVESQVGIAEGVFAAGLAARGGRVIEPGGTPAFLRSQPIEAIERPELTDLLRRLGLQTLGEFAALPAGDVLTRFGFDGALVHRLAAGLDHRPLAVRRPPPDLEVSETYDEPLERVDMAAFAGRALAERLHDKLAAHGLACTRLGIEAVTANGQELHRVWRHDGTLTAAAIAERVRWQLDGWLTGARRGAPARPTAGLVRLRLVPDGVLVHLGLQPGLWGDAGADRERAHRAFSRVQGLLGPESVVTPVFSGGRNADDQIRLVPWGDERDPHRPAAPQAEPVPGIRTHPVLAHVPPPLTIAEPDDGSDRTPAEPADGSDRTPAEPADGSESRTPGDTRPQDETGVTMVAVPPGGRRRRRTAPSLALPPWPGRLPKPAPALVLTRPLPAVVLDRDGTPVGVSARLELTADPAALIVERARPVAVTGWAGPWPVDERWWAPAESRRRARFQVVVADGRALLLSLAGGHWAVEALYD